MRVSKYKRTVFSGKGGLDRFLADLESDISRLHLETDRLKAEALKGLILKDSVDGHYYKITMSSGAIVITDLGTTRP